MALPDSIVRSEVATAIRDGYSGDFFAAAVAGSSVLTAVPRINMGTKSSNLPSLATRPTASWLTDTDNTAVKPKSKATWTNKTIVAEEVATIVAIHEDTIADATEDVLGEIAKLGGAAIGLKLDQAVLFGTDKPASWTSLDFTAAATSFSQTYETGASGNEDDLYGSHLIAAGAMADKGVIASSVIAQRSLAFKLANMRGNDGHMILTDNGLRGFDTTWNENGAWEDQDTISFLFDRRFVRVGVRQDITVKFLDQATITGPDGEQLNLAEHDMVALRFVARYGYVMNTGLTSTGVAAAPVAMVENQFES